MATTDLSVWEKELLRVIRETAPREYRKVVRQAGNLLRKYVRRETRKESGDLRKSYRIKSMGRDSIQVYTDKFYAKMVEEGHATPDGGFVPGKFYFQKGLEKTEQELPALLKDFVRRVGRELGMDVGG